MPTHGPDSSSIIQFTNCTLLSNHQLIRDDLWVRNGCILHPHHLFWEEKGYADVTIDCQDSLLTPGYIDIQVNGGFGVDFSTTAVDDVTKIEDKVSRVAANILQYGVTSFCPTLVTSPASAYHHILPSIKRCDGSMKGAGVLGVHIEGPFIHPQKKGAHDPRYILTPHRGFQDAVETYSDKGLDNVSLCTVAPEVGLATPNLVEKLVERGIVVSLGHSTADQATGERAMQAGATFITHLFNAMQPFHHRDPGLVGLLASDSVVKYKLPLFYGMIADLIHADQSALRMAHRTHPSGFILVTDGISAMGLPQGQHVIGGSKLDISGNRAVLANTNTLAGSIITMDECVLNMKLATDCSVVEALEAAALHPAQLLGITDKKGTLEPGSDADFLLLDKETLRVKRTYIAGECVWRGDGELRQRVKPKR